MGESVAAFVRRRGPAWASLASLLERRKNDTLTLAEVRELDRLYRQTTLDLAQLQTLHPHSEAHLFVNQLCARSYGALYRPESARLQAVGRFYRREFPEAVRRARGPVLLSASLLLGGVALGASLIAWDASQASWLVPAGVRAHVEAHTMWTDSMLSAAPPGVAASGIATNNLSVMVMAFASGILLGLGPVALLLSNGLQVGAIAALCLRAGMGHGLFGFIFAHGPVELSTIVIAGAAGLGLGQALIDPGERSRAVRVREQARAGIQLLLGCAPFLTAIALVEGFVSPGHLFAEPLKAGLGIALGVGFWAYVLGAGSETVAQPPGDLRG